MIHQTSYVLELSRDREVPGAAVTRVQQNLRDEPSENECSPLTKIIFLCYFNSYGFIHWFVERGNT